MEFAKVNFGLNQTYFVETSAFEKVVKGAMKKFKDYTVEETNIHMNKEQSNVKIALVLSTTKKTMVYSSDLPKIENEINEGVSNLIDGKPLNIKIQVKVGK